MKTIKRLNTKKAILILSVLLVGLNYFAFWIEGWTGAFLFLAVGLTGVILIGTSLYGMYLLIRTKSFNLILPVSISIIAIFIVIMRPFEYIIEKTKSPVILYGYCEHTVTGLSLKLREDNSFEYNAGAFLSKEMYFGNYTLNSDTIQLIFNDSIPNNVNNILILKENAIIEIGDSTNHRHSFKTTLNNLKNNKPVPNTVYSK